MLTSIIKNQPPLGRVAFRAFARWQDPTNDFLEPEFIERQNKLFRDTLSEREQVFRKADRIAMLAEEKEALKDTDLWWNRFAIMSADDMDLLPFTFLKKYGSFLTSIQDL